MRLLLDTHSAIWFMDRDPRLREPTRELIRTPANEVLLSAVVVWEIAIKRSQGRLLVDRDIREMATDGPARPLGVTLEHAAATEALPWHHQDPFDRLLVAQATTEGASIVSVDKKLRAYDVEIVW